MLFNIDYQYISKFLDLESKNDRQTKCTSTVSELDVFYMNSSVPLIDTPGELMVAIFQFLDD